MNHPALTLAQILPVCMVSNNMFEVDVIIGTILCWSGAPQPLNFYLVPMCKPWFLWLSNSEPFCVIVVGAWQLTHSVYLQHMNGSQTPVSLHLKWMGGLETLKYTKYFTWPKCHLAMLASFDQIFSILGSFTGRWCLCKSSRNSIWTVTVLY